MSKQINCFGFKQPDYRKTFNEIEPYQFETNGDNTYVRFDATTGNCAIIKINKSGSVYTQTYGYGKWADRATLTYPYAINDIATVED